MSLSKFMEINQKGNKANYELEEMQKVYKKEVEERERLIEEMKSYGYETYEEMTKALEKYEDEVLDFVDEISILKQKMSEAME